MLGTEQQTETPPGPLAFKRSVDLGAGQSEDHKARRSEQAASLLQSNNYLSADVNLKDPSLGSSAEKYGVRRRRREHTDCSRNTNRTVYLSRVTGLAGKPQGGGDPFSVHCKLVWFSQLGLGTHG